MVKLTKAFIDTVAAPAKGYAMHWDDKVSGFGLRVAPTGKRVFIVMGRVNKKQVQFTIGPYGTFTEDQARKKAQKILQDMREGINPGDTKKQDEAAQITLRQVADAYLARPGKLKENTKRDMERHVDKVFAAWKDKPIVAITEDGVRKRFTEMTKKGLTGKPAPASANAAMVTLRTLVRFAARQFKRSDGSPLILHNPVSTLSRDDWNEMKPRTRDIDESKIGAVWHKLTSARAELVARADRITPFEVDALAGIDLVRFLLLTGARRMEGAALAWDRVHLDDDPTKCWWHLPDPKNKNPVWLPLSSQAVELLKQRQAAGKGKLAFPSKSKAGHIMDTRAPLEMVSEVAGLRLSAHDLRRSFVSVGVATLGIDLHKIELLTNHVPKGVTARHYLRTSRLQYLQPEVQRIGDWIEQQGQIAAAKAAGANVVPIRA